MKRTRFKNSMLLTDWYKIGHPNQYHPNTQFVFSNATNRKSRIPGIDSTVHVGQQGFNKKYLVEHFRDNFFSIPEEEIIESFSRRVRTSLGKDLDPLNHKFYRENFPGDPYGHIRHLHRQGHLPLTIMTLPEGTRVPIRVPNTLVFHDKNKPEFFWLTNAIETLMSACTWQIFTSATIADAYTQIFDKYAMETVGNTDFVQFQGHDFSFRGMSSLESAEYSGAGHLFSFVGTDTIPAIEYLEDYYNADAEKELIGCSVAATEHAVMCSNTGFYVWDKQNGDWSKIGECEFEVFKYLITEVYPTGIISIVSDTFNLWQVILDFLRRLKDVIINRDGRLVIRPDSGDPATILCGHKIEVYNTLEDAESDFEDLIRESTVHGEPELTVEDNCIVKVDDKFYKLEAVIEWNRYDKQYYFIEEMCVKSTNIEPKPEEIGVVELLWNIFGGSITDKGYKLLDPHIGCIYGDSINLERAKDICERLKQKGFASINWVAGIGSYTYQMNTRDTFGMAIKATYCEALSSSGETLYEIPIFKDPITDDGTKKSARGLLAVFNINGVPTLKENATWSDVSNCMFEKVFENGKILKEYSLAEIKERIKTTRKQYA